MMELLLQAALAILASGLLLAGLRKLYNMGKAAALKSSNTIDDLVFKLADALEAEKHMGSLNDMAIEKLQEKLDELKAKKEAEEDAKNS